MGESALGNWFGNIVLHLPIGTFPISLPRVFAKILFSIFAISTACEDGGQAIIREDKTTSIRFYFYFDGGFLPQIGSNFIFFMFFLIVQSRE